MINSLSAFVQGKGPLIRYPLKLGLIKHVASLVSFLPFGIVPQFGESLGWGDGSVRSQNWHLNVKKGFSVYLRAFPDEVDYTSMSLEVRSYCWLSPGLLWAILEIAEKTKINWFSYNDLTCMQVFWTNDKFFHNLTEWNLWTSNLSHLGPYLSSVSEQEITPNWPKMIRVTHLCFYF